MRTKPDFCATCRGTKTESETDPFILTKKENGFPIRMSNHYLPLPNLETDASKS